MFTQLYICICTNSRLILGVIFVSALASSVIAAHFQLIPQNTLIAVNWEDKVTRIP